MSFFIISHTALSGLHSFAHVLSASIVFPAFSTYQTSTYSSRPVQKFCLSKLSKTQRQSAPYFQLLEWEPMQQGDIRTPLYPLICLRLIMANICSTKAPRAPEFCSTLFVKSCLPGLTDMFYSKQCWLNIMGILSSHLYEKIHGRAAKESNCKRKVHREVGSDCLTWLEKGGQLTMSLKTWQPVLCLQRTCVKEYALPWLVWLSWLEHRPAKLKVAGLISRPGTCLGCRFGPWSGRGWEATDRCFSPSLSPSLPLSL